MLFYHIVKNELSKALCLEAGLFKNNYWSLFKKFCYLGLGLLSQNIAYTSYDVCVRNSFATFAKELFRNTPEVSLKFHGTALLSLLVKQAYDDRGPHLIIGLEEDKKPLRGKFKPYVKGDLALIIFQGRSISLEAWLKSSRLIIGQDPKTSSTGRAFEKWLKDQGYDKKDLFYKTCASLAGSFLTFIKNQDKAMVGYVSTPLFASRDFNLKALPLPGAQEVWGLVITERGLKDPRTPAIVETLVSSKARYLIKTTLFLEAFF